MIERLLRLVSQKAPGADGPSPCPPPAAREKAAAGGTRKRRKLAQPQKIVAGSVQSSSPPCDGDGDGDGEGEGEKSEGLLCRNLACQAILDPEDAFCKRCSCCICYSFDENKDPSLSCGLSCHLKCALRDERCGIARNSRSERLDGGFYCAFCKKENGLIGNLRKQLVIAKDARRVDLLCKRVSLSHQILRGTESYRRIQTIVDSAAKKLKKEVGPLDKVSARMARGIVNRLACSAEVQKLCAFAIEAIDLVLSDGSPISPVGFEDVSSTSVVISVAAERRTMEDAVVGYRLWHRRSCEVNYSEEPTCVLLRPERRIMVSGLSPATEYSFKVAAFGGAGELGRKRWEATLVTRASSSASNGFNFFPVGAACDGERKRNGGEPTTMAVHTNSQRGSTSSSDSHREGNRRLEIGAETAGAAEDVGTTAEAPPPFLAGSDRLPAGTTSKCDAAPKAQPAAGDRGGGGGEPAERRYEYCVKVIRWLECEGHMEKEFRVKFLTWFSLKATAQERRVVSAFIDVLIDEPASLVDQLVDSFKDGICQGEEKPPNGVCNGKLAAKDHRLCTRLWH
ncbi:unnamed protein product [Spirodela intermedia]|uniref:Fibronectin type-III domain-containing protein n=1 Tax=Spirodela intermedia TaxID=51605 RepID=A0A7I8I7S6_SPIIN|nr:unnamed protein product [Spirodela intermedia]CAA6653433.1 unnamed protein product [Spirodela intermedia]